MLNTIILQAAQQGLDWSFFVMMILIIAIFYFLFIRPQQKRQNKIQEERSNLEKGSQVITQGGIYGKVREVKDNVFVIEITDNVKITVDKNCVYPASDPQAAIENAQNQK